MQFIDIDPKNAHILNGNAPNLVDGCKDYEAKIKAAGGITQAVDKLLAYDNHQRPIEVEVTNLDELREALTCPVDRIMLDNMDNTTMAEAVEITADKIDLEASGNVNLDTIEGISLTGVDYVSIGALTHSVKAMDYSLLVSAPIET